MAWALHDVLGENVVGQVVGRRTGRGDRQKGGKGIAGGEPELVQV